MEVPSRKSLSEELAVGRSEAFAELYDILAVRIYRFLVVRLGSRADADDVLQEVFVRLVRSREQFSNVDNLVAYVFTVARNEAARFAKRRSRRQAKECSLDAELIFVCGDGQGEQQRELAEILAVGLDRLRKKYREIVELKFFAGLTFAEIATVTGSPPGTVATRYRKAIQQLREFVERQES